jgi:hypothetical protein
MKKILFLCALVLTIATAGALASNANSAPPQTSGLSVPITGTVAGVEAFVGQFTVDRFTTQNGQLAAVGTLTGTLNGVAITPQQITVPVTASGTCQILHLELGPLDLNLLGLMVHLDQVVLDITAQSGPGNLLGNLLCGIAGLLDSDAPLNQIARLLNQLLGILG